MAGLFQGFLVQAGGGGNRTGTLCGILSADLSVDRCTGDTHTEVAHDVAGSVDVGHAGFAINIDLDAPPLDMGFILHELDGIGGKVDMFRLHVVCHGGNAFPVESFFHFIEPGGLRSGTIDKNGPPAITKRFCQDPVGYIQGHVAIFPVGASDERADGRAVRIAGNADERSLAAAGKVLGTGMDIRNFHIQHVECMPPGQ